MGFAVLANRQKTLRVVGLQFAAAGRQKDRRTDSQTQKESRERERDPIDLRKRMFYDLSLGYEGVEDQTRREVVAMALQLGYTGVAANHMLTGIMADSDRSRIKPLELESVIAAAPGVAEAAKFHRKLLKVPAAQPFRQFSRITVVVEDTVQAAALNSANPVLRSYDIVAVRPKNQKAFNQACTHLEVKERDKKITYIPLNSSSQKFAT